ncbi:MAG: N-acetyltransferase, partial [Gaiellaceae bacterium]|nr:N-acetyltransferase [Gaiellaceae bacterium]
MPPDVRLRPLREDEFPAWDAAHRREYLHGLVEHAGLPAADAEAKVERDLAAVLPDGLATADVRIWAVEAGGATVGSVFLGLRDGGAWLYDITIADAERGRGYGRAAMVALEDEVRALGFDR